MIIQRDMARRDWDNKMALAEERGIKIGEAKGEAKGKNEEKIEIARKMLKRNYNLEDIAEDTGLSIERIQALKK
jgi:predicted transposase/invertase (TIGR01784 family)